MSGAGKISRAGLRNLFALSVYVSFIVVLALSMSASVHANASPAKVRVLVKFNPAGHQLHRVVPLAASAITSNNDSEFAAKPDVAANRYHAALRWLDQNGELLASATMPDPRVTHAPLSDDGQSPTFVALFEGAYVVAGPGNSKVLEIDLPANPGIGLAAAVWRLDLTITQ